MNILGIDPGTEKSAWVYLENGKIESRGLRENEYVRDMCRHCHRDNVIAIEMIACYGMEIGASTIETAVWTGRFIERASVEVTRVYRKDIKLHLCGTMRAKDKNVRQALIDRFGGEKAIGRKNTPGPLYGVHSHIWAALAVAVYAQDMAEAEAKK